MHTLKVFLASSFLLAEERIEFERFISRENDDLVEKGIYIKLLIWEKLKASISPTRLQDEYNTYVQECDVFVMLFHSKVGKFTHEEFTTAYNTFKETGKPIIYTYFKEAKINTKDISDDILSMLNFKRQIRDIGHFYSTYENTEGLLLHFSKQLQEILKTEFPDSAEFFFEKSAPKQIEEEPTNLGWTRLKNKDFQLTNEKNISLFYEGATPSWGILKQGTFERDVQQKIIAHFDDRNPIALIKGAGGEGKSTLMMQLGLYYYTKKYQVFLVNNTNIDIAAFRKQIKGDTLILIDEANQFENLYDLINQFRIYSNVKIIMTARSNEWYHFLSKNPKSGAIKRIVSKSEEFVLKALSSNEIEKLTTLLLKNEVISEDKGKKWKQDLKQESKERFLLATMLKATKGKGLELILQDVLERISNWEDGFLALKVLGIIVSLEVKKGIYGDPLYCTNTLLTTYLKKIENIDEKKYFKIRQYLFQEAFIQDNREKQTTRNPEISKLFYKYLFRNDAVNLLSESEILYGILYASVIIDDHYGRNLISAIPSNYNAKNDAQLLSKVYRTLHEFGYSRDHFSLWSQVENHLKNTGDYDKKYSAKWIYKTAVDRKSKNYVLYMKFAEIEEKQNNIGDYDTEYSVKWLLKEATINCMNYTPYIKISQIEEKQDNIGDYHIEYSAKWWLLKATENSNYYFPYIRLAEIEEKQDNIGDYHLEYSAKWWLLKATENSKYHASYVKLAEIEEKQDNIGDYLTEKSAKWWLLKATQNSKDHASFIKLADIEEKQNNVGDYHTKYSAKWWLSEAIQNFKYYASYVKLAAIEEKQGNIGDYDKEKSAKWWLYKATENSKDHTGYVRLAEIEESQGNIGDYLIEKSAKWWLLKAIQNSKDHTAYLRLAEIEERQGNIGDYHKEKSTKWWLLKTTQNSKDHTAYLRLAEIEEKEDNTGDYDIKYSTKWWLFKATQDSDEHLILIKLAEIEERQGNIGDYHKEKSAKWWLLKATKQYRNYVPYMRLATIEERQGNIGNYELENSVKWWLFKAIENSKWSMAYIKLAAIEEGENNIGAYDSKRSAKWWLLEALKTSDFTNSLAF
jgi:ribosomal protein S15P/S13E